MGKIIYKIIAVSLIITHLWSFYFKDIAWAREAANKSSGPNNSAQYAADINYEALGKIPDPAGHGSPPLVSYSPYNPLGSQAASSSSQFFQKDTHTPSSSFNRILETVSGDLFTGKANMNIPLFIPSGKRDIPVPLSISYASSSANSIAGVGWSLNIPEVKRSLKKGVPSYGSSDKFILDEQELVNISSGQYRAEIESGFNQIALSDNSWQVTDKLGNKHLYGSSDNSRLTISKGTFAWALDKIADTKGNYLTIDYFKDENTLYPSVIYWTANESGLSAKYKLTFSYEDRSDVTISYITGAKAKVNKRLSKIELSYDNSLVRRYEFEYSLGASTRRSLLTKVREYGSDSTSSSADITFTYSSHSGSWSADKSQWHIPDGSFIKSGQDQGRRVYDLNGDGMFDFVISRYDPNESSGRQWLRETYLNSKDGFSSSANWWPVPKGYFIYNTWDDGRRLVDLTGDGIPELLAATLWDSYLGNNSGQYKTAYVFRYLDAGNPKWEEDTDWNLPDGYFVYGNKVDGGRRFGDLNGDGLNDLSVAIEEIKWGSRPNDVIAKAVTTYLNTGSGWKQDSAWNSPDGYYVISSGDGGRRLADINGDGLADFLIADGSTKAAYLNNSGGWTRDDNFNLPDGNFAENGLDQGRMVVDINGDGLNDILIAKAGYKSAYINTGSGFRQDDSFNLPDGDFVDSSSTDQGRYLADLDGDGLIDLCAAKDDYKKAYLNLAKTPDILERVNNGLGGQTDIEYSPSTSYSNYYSNKTGKLPFAFPAVSRITSSDGQGNSYVTKYEYKDGMFDADKREFRGFGYCKVTDAEGNYSESYFKQDSVYKGKPYKQETKDSSGNLYARSENTWSKKELYSGVNFAYISQSDSYIYDGDSSCKQTRVTYEYDDYGNPAKVKSEGDVSESGDEKTLVMEYNYNTSNWIVGLPKSTKLTDSNGDTVSQKWFYYDGASSYDTSPSQGLLTKEEVRLSNSEDSSEKKISSQYSYDSYGNLTKATNAKGYSTTTEYDSTVHSYPVKVTNSKGHTLTNEYDYKTGQVTKTTDANSQTTQYQYDSLGRLTAAIGPKDSESSPGVRCEYDLSSQPIKVTKKTKSDYSGNYLSTYQFSDGLGRLIETKGPAQDESYQIVSGIVTYDQRGQVKEQYLPYLVSASASFSSPSYSGYHFSFDYDPAGRQTQAINPDGTYSSTNYSDWTLTKTDENGNYHTYYNDAYGRVTKVEEHNDSETYATAYTYDALGNLTKVKDSKGNTNYIYYDSLGRKVKMDDPDMGTWSYEYDDLGNLTKQTDAKSQVLEFEYDELNRLTKKKATSPESKTLSAYSYDESSKDYCKGRLSKITDQSGQTEFWYDSLGRETKSTKTIDSSSYTVEREYDSLDRLTKLKYPDSNYLEYTYSAQGPTKVRNGYLDKDYVQEVTYNANGQITYIKYGNNVETNYTYDEKTLRLSNLKTEGSQGALQNLSYEFYNNGNVKGITDSNYGYSQSFSYDDLNRLTYASGSYGSISYSYDSIGNMLSNGSTNYSYNSDKPHAVSSLSDGSSFEYDSNGNLKSRVTSGSKTINYSYDYENRLTKSSPGDSNQSNSVSVTLTLSPGWNFFALPVIPDSLEISSVFSSISSKYSQVSRYNPEKTKFEHYVQDSDFNQFTSLEYGRGYQVYISGSSSVSLTVSGKTPSEQITRSLKKGWNLIGCPSNDIISVKNALNNLERHSDYDSLQEYYASSGKYIEMGTEVNMSVGEAYFIHCLKDTSWKLSYSQATSSVTTSFTYDGDGGRVKKYVSSSGLTTTYVGSLYEVDSEDNAKKHIYLGSQRVLTVDGISQTHYCHSDHLGSSNVISDTDGKKEQRLEYYPYGKTYVSDGTKTTNYKYTGKEEDSSTGLYFYGARYYDPDLGKFTQPDTIVQSPYDPQSLNRYSYCRNNPINYTDPTGHSWWKKFWGSVVGAVAAVVSIAIPVLAPVMWAVNMGISAYTAVQTGNILGFAGGIAGGAVFGAIGKGLALGLSARIRDVAWHFAGGALGGAVEFGMGGFGAGLGAALASGESFKDSLKAGGFGAAIGAATGAVIQGSYVEGWQDVLHGYSIPELGAAQAGFAFQNRNFMALPRIDSAMRTRTDGKYGLWLHGTDKAGGIGISISRQLNEGSWMTLPGAVDSVTGKIAMELNPAEYQRFTSLPRLGEVFALIVAPKTSVMDAGFAGGGAPQYRVYGSHVVTEVFPNLNK